MTPAQVARAALRLADALDVVRDEMGRTDACRESIFAHAGCAEELARALVHAGVSVPDAPAHVVMSRMFDIVQGRFAPSSDLLMGWADTWRSWGEARRAEVERAA